VLSTTRSQLVRVGADARRHLKALIVTAPHPLRQALRRRSWLQQARVCAALHATPTDSIQVRATVQVMRLTAQRLLAAYAEAAELTQQLHALITTMTPGPGDQPGVGPISAAQVLLAWSHPGRVRSEAAFAMLAGAAPIEASSGQVVRHRLNRGGDRQLNRGLHTIVIIRQLHDPATRAHTARRTAQGKSPREIRRCLKRMVARQLFRLLERTATNQIAARQK